MKFAVALAFAALTALPASAGTKIDDPVAFVKGVYAHWDASQPEPKGVFTPRLDALIALDAKEAGGEVGRANDFSFWCNCQDGDVKKVTVRGWDVENAPGRTVVEAKFLLETTKQDIIFYFEKTKDGWKIDDIQSLGDPGWTLSVIAKYGFPNKK